MGKVETVTKAELIKLVAEKTDYTQKDVRAVLETTAEICYAEMAKQKEVKLFEGCSLVGMYKEAGVARNPQTGEQVDVPAKVLPKAKFGKAAKDSVNSLMA